MVVAKRDGSLSNACRNSAGPLNLEPSGSTPVASIGAVASLRTQVTAGVLSASRQRPTASKFSKAKPAGSMILWQPAQAGLERCSAMRSRIEITLPPTRLSSFNGGILAGGGAG